MGPIFAAAVIFGLAATCKYMSALGRRIDADIDAVDGCPVAAEPTAARAATFAKTHRYSEREFRRRSRALIDEIELFLAGRDC